MTKKKHKHEDTSISLRPLSFEEAIKELAKAPKQKGSQAVSRVSRSCSS